MSEDCHVELEEVLHADEQQVVDAVRDGGRLKGSDAEVTNRFFHVWTFCDRKIVQLSIRSESLGWLKSNSKTLSMADPSEPVSACGASVACGWRVSVLSARVPYAKGCGASRPAARTRQSTEGEK